MLSQKSKVLFQNGNITQKVIILWPLQHPDYVTCLPHWDTGNGVNFEPWTYYFQNLKNTKLRTLVEPSWMETHSKALDAKFTIYSFKTTWYISEE